MPARLPKVKRRSATALAALPFRDLAGGIAEMDLSAAPYAEDGPAGTGAVLVTPSLSWESDGFSAGKAEDLAGGRVTLRGGL